MEKKNFIVERIKKSDEEKLYIFYNLTKNQGIKRMRPQNQSNIQIGEIVKMNGETYQLFHIFDFRNGELISWIGE
jgi:hypothetical protein